MTPEIIVVFVLWSIACVMVGLVSGIDIEYHNCKREIRRQQADETKRLQELAEIVECTNREVGQVQS